LNSGAARSLRFLATLSCVVLFGARSYTQGNQEKQPQAVQVRVERVNVGVLVTDQSGHLVEGLKREDFRVFDNGAEQALTGFAAIEEPAQVLLLIEAGPAVYLLESGHLQAANLLLKGLSPDDRVAVVRYAEAPARVLDFTANKRAAAAALERLQFNLGFGALNLSSSVSEVLNWMANIPGKKTIVLLSTGLDTSSQDGMTKVMGQLKVRDVRLLAISLAGGLQSPPPSKKKKPASTSRGRTDEELERANELLKQMAESSGGRAYFPASEKEFDAVYGQIAQMVRHEYSLAFAPPAHDGLVHSIEVRVNSPQAAAGKPKAAGYRVDHRKAYLAPTL
jgi:VWFA-related protein